MDDLLPVSAVRWYWYKDPVGHGIFKGPSLASVLLQDVPAGRTTTRFNTKDSAALERAYRLDRDAIETAWWEEEGNLLEEQLTNNRGGAAASSPSKFGVHDAEGQGGAESAGAAGVSAGAAKDAAIPMANQQQKTLPVSPLANQAAVERRQSQSWADFIGSPMKGAVLLEEAPEEIGTIVRGRHFEVDLHSRLMRPCYWPGRKHRVVRGTWFLDKQGDFLPLREAIAEQLETAFVSRVWDPSKKRLTVQRDGRMAARVELGSFQGSVVTFALFYSGYDICMVEDTSFAWIKKKLSKSGGENRYQLRRGYVEPAADALQREADIEEEKANEEMDKRPTPTALVLAVHGIGQNVSGANIIQDAVELKQVIRKAEAAAAAAADKGAASGKGTGNEAPPPASASASPSSASDPTASSRIEVLPVQWRKTLNLEIDGLAASLMPPGISSLRHVLHSTAVEVLFYLTPMHRAVILDSVVNSLNVVYKKFVARNPDFDGPVSLFAHSLGSVLCWDVLCNQPSASGGRAGLATPPKQPSTPAWAPSALDIGKLAFEVDQFIVAGSPLGCFLALRGVNQAAGMGLGTAASAALMHTNHARPGSPHGLPQCRRMFNVYHPLDPVAYKLEPLAYSQESLAGRKSALVDLAGGGRRLHIAAEEFGDALVDNVSRFGSSIAGYFTSASGKKRIEVTNAAEAADFVEEGVEGAEGEGVDGEQSRRRPDEEGMNVSTSVPVSASSTIAGIVGGRLPDELGRPRRADGRLDFALQEASLEHQYVQALGSHFSYWNSLDVGKFVMRAVCGKDVLSGE